MKSLSYKIGLGYFVLICINIAIAVFAIYHIHQLGSPIDRVLREKYQNVSAAENMIQSLKQQELTQNVMVKDGLDSTLINNFHTYKNEFLNWHQRAIEGIALPTEPDILDSIMFDFRQYLLLSDTLHIILRKGILLTGGQSFHRNKIMPKVSKLDYFCNRLKKVNQQAIASADQQAKRFSSRGTLLIVVISLLAIALSVAASIRFTRTILKPVKETTDTVRKISRGQLNQKIHITTDDEIAELGREFNKMTARLQEYEQMNFKKIITEKKKSEAIVENMPVAIIVTDDENKLTLLNAQAMKILNLTDENWQSKSLDELVRDKDLVKKLISSHSDKHETPDFQKSIVSIQNVDQKLHFIKRHIEIKDENKLFLGLVTILQDVTSFKNLNHLKSEFMATISHEYRTPLTSINMAVDILMREVLGKINQDQRELLTDAKNDCLRLKGLVKDLLDLSKLESGKYPMNYQQIEIQKVLEYSLQPLRRLADQKKVCIKIQLEEQSLALEADFRHLARAVTNLVENAIQYEPESGEVIIEIKSENGMIRFCVQDHGPGIPPEAIDLIFDKFVQVKDFKDSAEGNIGLGLAIAREVVQMHHGKIWVESKLKEGSRFYFSIPIKGVEE